MESSISISGGTTTMDLLDEMTMVSTSSLVTTAVATTTTRIDESFHKSVTPPPMIMTTSATPTTTTTMTTSFAIGNGIGGSSGGGGITTNKSSLSSSTSSLVSTNSSSTATTPLVFAPPPTPSTGAGGGATSSSLSTTTSFVAQQQQQQHSQSQSQSMAAAGHFAAATTIPLYQLGIGNSSMTTCFFNNNKNNVNNTGSTFAESLFDGGTVMFARLNRIGAAVAPDATSAVSHMIINSGFEVDEGSSPSNHRRECKSTSDESYTLELEEQSLIASAANKIAASRRHNGGSGGSDSGSGVRDNFLYSTSTNMYRLNGGQFGFNPNPLRSGGTGRAGAALATSASSRLRLHTAALPPPLPHHHRIAKAAATVGGGGGECRKTVKRLSGQSKFFIEHLKKHNHHSDYNYNRKLFFAVSNNELKTVHDLLENNMYDVNCQDDKQRTCLHIASSRGYIEIVRALLEHGANPNVRDCVNNLPIHLAIIASHVPVVTVLLEAGTDIHSLDVHGKTVLHLAGTRLRWLLNDDNHKASPKLKFEAIMIMNMIKEYLRRKKAPPANDLDSLAAQLESSFNLDDINSLTKQLLNQFETLNITNKPPS